MERLQIRKPRSAGGGGGAWSLGVRGVRPGPAASALGLHSVCPNPHACPRSPGKIQGGSPRGEADSGKSGSCPSVRPKAGRVTPRPQGEDPGKLHPHPDAKGGAPPRLDVQGSPLGPGRRRGLRGGPYLLCAGPEAASQVAARRVPADVGRFSAHRDQGRGQSPSPDCPPCRRVALPSLSEQFGWQTHTSKGRAGFVTASRSPRGIRDLSAWREALLSPEQTVDSPGSRELSQGRGGRRSGGPAQAAGEPCGGVRPGLSARRFSAPCGGSSGAEFSCGAHLRAASEVTLKDQSRTGRAWGFLGPQSGLGVREVSVVCPRALAVHASSCRVPKGLMSLAVLEFLDRSPFPALVLPHSQGPCAPRYAKSSGLRCFGRSVGLWTPVVHRCYAIVLTDAGFPRL